MSINKNIFQVGVVILVAMMFYPVINSSASDSSFQLTSGNFSKNLNFDIKINPKNDVINVVLNNKSDNASQFWSYNAQTKQIVNNFNNKCVDVKNGVVKNRSKLILSQCSQAQAQKWFLDINGSVSVDSNRAFCIDGSTLTSGFNLQLSKCNNGLSQKWYQLSQPNTEPKVELPPIPKEIYYPGTCKELKKLRLGNFLRNSINYSASRDSDKDGVACELK